MKKGDSVLRLSFSVRNSYYLLTLLLLAGVAWTRAEAQMDVAASVYGALNQSTNGNTTKQNPSDQAGVLLEMRYISNPLLGYELTYAYNRANQTYRTANISTPGGVNANNLVQSVKANAHQVTADWVVSLKMANLRPFALAGAGLMFFHPDSGQTGTSGNTKGVLVYGAGVDWTVLPHMGARFQYRGNVYKAPDLAKAFSSTDRFTHSAEPMIGVFLRF